RAGRDAAARYGLGRLFGLFRRSRRAPLGARLEPVLPPRRTRQPPPPGLDSLSAPIDLPKWADTVLVPAVSVVCAFLVAGLVVLGIGENPLTATRWLIQGALGSGEGLGFTLFYATNFIFTGLAVAVAYHAGLFNIGGEGQATLGGLGCALVVLHAPDLPGYLLVPLGVLGA